MNNICSPVFRGCATAIVTPFRDGEIDFSTFGKLIDRQIAAGVSGLVVCGTTGEASTMSVTEHLACIDFALERVDGKLPVIAGTGNNCTKKAISLSKNASELGADALLVVTPYYNKASEEGLYRHFSSIADESKNPIMLYNVPSRTGVNISLSVYERLSYHDNIIGVKEASGNLSSIASMFERCGERFHIYSGNDDQILPILSLGGSGVVSVASNIIPREIEDICQKYFSNETDIAARAQLNWNDLFSALFCEVNPIPVKYAMSLMGLCPDEMRLPLCPPSENSRARIRDTLEKHGLL